MAIYNFIKEKTEKGFINIFSGKKNSIRYTVVNHLGQKGCLPNENTAYSPLGGVKTLKSVLNILEFKTV